MDSRIFMAATNFGACHTAMKIIYGIIDIWLLNRRLGQGWNTKIINNTNIINVLGKAIKNIVNYSLYQKLDSKIKDEIRELIITELSKKAQDYEAEERHYGLNHPITSILVDLDKDTFNSDDQSRFKKGIQTWTATFTNRVYVVATQLPPDLFCNCDLLKKHIYVALREKYANILLPNAYFTVLSQESKKSISNVKRNTLMVVQLQRLNPLFAQLPDEVCAHIASFTSNPTIEVSQGSLDQIANENFVRRHGPVVLYINTN